MDVIDMIHVALLGVQGMVVYGKEILLIDNSR